MTGTVYTVLPIPPDAAHTTYIAAGVLSIGVEWRQLDDAELAARYEGDAMDEIQDHVVGEVDDRGVSIHVMGSDDCHEYLRFDVFDEGPHYHYIERSGEKQTIVDYDPVALGEMLPWTLKQLRTRLGTMLTHAGGADLAAKLETNPIDASLEDVERLARKAQAALARSRR